MLAFISFRSVSLPRFWAKSRLLAAAVVAFSAAPALAQDTPQVLQPGTMAARVAACTACHGAVSYTHLDVYKRQGS